MVCKWKNLGILTIGAKICDIMSDLIINDIGFPQRSVFWDHCCSLFIKITLSMYLVYPILIYLLIIPMYIEKAVI